MTHGKRQTDTKEPQHGEQTRKALQALPSSPTLGSACSSPPRHKRHKRHKRLEASPARGGSGGVSLQRGPVCSGAGSEALPPSLLLAQGVLEPPASGPEPASLG